MFCRLTARPFPIAAALLGAVLALGPAPSRPADASPTSLASYFPLAPGAVRVYRRWLLTGRQESRQEPYALIGKMTVRTRSAIRVEGRACHLVEVFFDPPAISLFEPTPFHNREARCYGIAADGVFLHFQDDRTFSPPLRLLASPVRPGVRWEWAGEIGGGAHIIAFTWVRRETVNVPAGRFSTMQLYFELGDRYRRAWHWYAQGVGLVKEDIIDDWNQFRFYAELERVTKGP